MQKTFVATLFIITVLVLISGAAIVAYRIGKSEQNIVTTGLPPLEPSTSVTLTPTLSLTTSPSPSVTPTPTVNETSLIKQAVYAKTGLNESKAEVTISQNTGQHAKGSIREFEAVGGGYFLAAKTGSGWVEVYDGQANPTCEQIAPYNFPKSMVPECLDASGRVIIR